MPSIGFTIAIAPNCYVTIDHERNKWCNHSNSMQESFCKTFEQIFAGEALKAKMSYQFFMYFELTEAKNIHAHGLINNFYNGDNYDYDFLLNVYETARTVFLNKISKNMKESIRKRTIYTSNIYSDGWLQYCTKHQDTIPDLKHWFPQAPVKTSNVDPLNALNLSEGQEDAELPDEPHIPLSKKLF